MYRALHASPRTTGRASRTNSRLSGRTRLAAAGAVGLLALSTVSACSSSGGSGSGSSSASSSTPSSSSGSPTASSSTGTGTAQTASITIKDYKYAGASTVSPGTKVTVTNKDSEAHTVTSDKGGAFDVVVPPGKSITFTAPATAGSVSYHCTYHGNMRGMLKVA